MNYITIQRPVPGARYTASDDEAERLFGPCDRVLVAEVNRLCPPGPVAFVAGICSRCGSECSTQVATMHINVPGKNEALCTGCLSKDAEKRRGDWFASEERASR